MKSISVIRRIISNPVIQTLAVYVSGSWVLIELIEYLIAHFNLSEKFRLVFLIILLCGLPIALIIAWFTGREKEPQEAIIKDRGDKQAKNAEVKRARKFRSYLRTPGYILPGILVILILLVFGIRHINLKAKIKWANERALPEIEAFLDLEDYPSAFELIQKAERFIAEDPRFKEFQQDAVVKQTILSDPPGADVYIREYGDTAGVWRNIGQTPIDSMKFPGYTIYRMKFNLEGYEPVLAVVSTEFDTVSRKLFKVDSIPPEMVYVEGYSYEWPNYRFQEDLGFFMDRFEVTNKQFKKFIDQGGYSNPVYWKHEFVKDGGKISWEEAMREFTDRTGQPGPATWEASDYQDGREEHPVCGVSWYEAAAYAEFAGKSLPTGWHWASAAGVFIDPFTRNSYYSRVVPNSNFKGKGTLPVGTMQGVNMFGVYDMAGNVREWCYNMTKDGRITCGGAWDDNEYMYSSWSQLPPFDRSHRNGIRCVKYLDWDSIHAKAFQEVAFREVTDYGQIEPVPDEVFAIYRNQFLYDKTDLNASIDELIDSLDEWTMETVSFDAAYGDERVTAYLYIPKNSPPPYQTIIYFPGVGAVYTERDLGTLSWTIWFIDYFMKSGRAVMLPVYKGTSFRNDGLTSEMSNVNRSHQFTDWLIAWTKDFSRSIDYLETRADIDTSKLGFLGWSWGGEIGGVIPAVEKRIKVNLLVLGGFTGTAYPEADPVNYVSRINVPVLMLNGRYDIWRPYETNLKPFFEMLGTPEEHKKLILYETDHYIPKRDMIKENLAFLDKYFGPVK